MIREQDRPALRRLISSVFVIEDEHNDELTAIANGEGTKQERAERYLDFIIDKMDFVGNV